MAQPQGQIQRRSIQLRSRHGTWKELHTDETYGRNMDDRP